MVAMKVVVIVGEVEKVYRKIARGVAINII